jgi:hypothetical protein
MIVITTLITNNVMTTRTIAKNVFESTNMAKGNFIFVLSYLFNKYVK